MDGGRTTIDAIDGRKDQVVKDDGEMRLCGDLAMRMEIQDLISKRLPTSLYSSQEDPLSIIHI